ncbi:efflux RND transporter permease subunit [Halosquirtibacter laminarini]|uniref:Efflux RND transporter permease subunit n=2 Tax=Halosquirtibacter laminarini TaxID=3374600 RepID=A0AC61NQ77_9BACT|nr:efflux RND transporter permease subunit [Prolixibacteraceae bacterium]
MKEGIAGKIAKQFINSKLTPLLMLLFLGLGFYGASLTPREEEPQISVPIADIFVQYPGANPDEVASRVSKPLEKIVSNISGVEYVYSTSMKGQAQLVVQFYVGEDIERSIVKLYNEIVKHMDQVPKGVSMPLVKTRSIDDVPVMSLTLWSDNYDDYQIRRIASEVADQVGTINDIAQVKVIGGRSRQFSVTIDPDRLRSYGLDATMISRQLSLANGQKIVGSFFENNHTYSVKTGTFLRSKEDLEHIIVTTKNGVPVYLDQVAVVEDGPGKPSQYVTFGYGEQNEENRSSYPATTISIAKRNGADAMKVADLVLDKVSHLEENLIPSDVHIEVTRNYGETASHKVDELMWHLLGSILAVTLIVALSMGWRGGLVVFLSVPVTFALTLFVYYLLGYTLNRITLFALVFVTGIVVDDSIIIAENMHRHFRMGKKRFMDAALESISEVGNPTILATFTVIAAVLPMVAVSGMMGPYMSPMPIGAAFAMIFSLLVALTITPFIAYRLLKKEERTERNSGDELEGVTSTWIYKAYYKVMTPLLSSKKRRWTFIGAVVLLLLGSVTLFYVKWVAVKMLPFDNKNEYQVVIDMPEGTSLEKTYEATQALANYIKNQPEVEKYTCYVGTASPITFNGLVRHYDLRGANNMADIQVNLTDKDHRDIQSHDLAKAVRPGLEKIANNYGAKIKVVEMPPGPPVLSTLVVEVYGPDAKEQQRIAKNIEDIFNDNSNVVDVDSYVESDNWEFQFTINKQKAAMRGVGVAQIEQVLYTALHGSNMMNIIQSEEQKEVPVIVQYNDKEYTSVEDLKHISMVSQNGSMVYLGDVVDVEKRLEPKSIYRKNQHSVTFVTAEVAGDLESPVYPMLDVKEKIEAIPVSGQDHLLQMYNGQPFNDDQYVVKWDGEWQITYDVFRDLGIAFAVVIVIIYMLIIGWFQDYKVPIIMMISIPLSLGGILIGHWLLGAYFTATSMIGLIALAGIMVRNAILLVDFIHIRLKERIPMKQAIIEAGAVRTTPILLTAGTVVIGAFVILFDPIFQGLAISLMGGSIASTALTLVIVPLIFYMVYRKRYQ